MEKTSILVNNIYSGTNKYLRLQARSAKLEVYERVTNLIASGISTGFILLFAVFAFLFINIGLAFWLSDVMHSTKLGFLTLGGFYIVVLGIYILLKDKIAKNKIKNIILLKVSKTHNDYDLLMQEQDAVHAEVEASEKQIEENMAALKENFETIKEDLNKLKSHFVSEGEGEEKVGPKIPRIAITSLVDLLMRKVVLRKAGFLKKAVLPLIADTLVTSAVFKENKKTSLFENLKLKFSKFL